MERAADSVAKDGIGCTSQLEHGLNAAAQTMCRELMGAHFKAGRLDELHNWRVKDLRQVAFDAA